MALMLGQSRIRILILIIATVFGLIVTYHGSGTFGSIGSVTTLEFFLIYLGGPFRVISNNFFVAGIGGAVFIAGCVHCARIWLQREERNPMFLAFVIFLFYVAGTGLATASGRVTKFGLVGATAGRYLTPVFLGWAVLSILVGYHYREHVNYPGAVLVISTLFPLLFIPSQLDSIYGNASLTIHQHMIAALALDLGVNDKEAIRKIFPDDRIYAAASEAKRLHLSIFELPVFRNAKRYLGEQAERLPLHGCQGHIDTIVLVNGVDNVSRVEGWAFDETTERVPQEVFFVDSNDKVVGVGLTGFPRADVAPGS